MGVLVGRAKKIKAGEGRETAFSCARLDKTAMLRRLDHLRYVILGSLRTADAFSVVASLPPKKSIII